MDTTNNKSYYASWRESGTNDNKTSGPFETIEQARKDAMTRLYRPIHNTLIIYEVDKAYSH